MQHLSTYLENFEEENSPFHIILLIDPAVYTMLDVSLNEGRWEPSNEKGYWQRVDKPHFDFEMRHVHVAQQKHINTKTKQVSWNADGTRHDRSSFNDNMKGMERAQRVAKNALGLPNDAILECLNAPREGKLLLESVENLPSYASVYIFKVTDKAFLLS